MIRTKIFTLAIAAMVCLLVASSATAECAGCNSGCATGNCGAVAAPCSAGCGHGCGHGCLGGGHYGGQTGGCVTCANIWDDYCATKTRCLPHAKCPFQKYHGHLGCAGCCGVRVGVGIYGIQSCGHCGLFKHKKACCEPECDVVVESDCDTGCAECASADASTQTAATARQGYMVERPATQETATMPTSLRYAPAAPKRVESKEMFVPRAPRLPEDTRSSSSGFDWLQRALKIQ